MRNLEVLKYQGCKKKLQMHNRIRDLIVADWKPIKKSQRTDTSVGWLKNAKRME